MLKGFWKISGLLTVKSEPLVYFNYQFGAPWDLIDVETSANLNEEELHTSDV